MAIKRIEYAAALLFFLCASCTRDQAVRIKDPLEIVLPATHAGSWYPSDPQELRVLIRRLFAKVGTQLATHLNPASVRLLVAPHAGYRYSGLCAAAAYASVAQRVESDGAVLPNQKVKRVVVLAPSHARFFSGLAVPEATHLGTPLGALAIDQKACKRLLDDGVAQVVPYVFQQEHSLEMQLPFIKTVMPNAKVVPVIVGNLGDQLLQLVVQSLSHIIDAGTLVCVSSDFVHHGASYEYQPFATNIVSSLQMLDGAVLQAIYGRSVGGLSAILASTGATVCGQQPLKLAMALCQTGVMSITDMHLACYYTSAHVAHAGQPSETMPMTVLYDQVPDTAARASVSYVALVGTSDRSETTCPQLTDYQRQSLLALAHATIKNGLLPKDQQVDPVGLVPIASPALLAPHGVFVSLHTLQGVLRGCIGRIVSDQPLYHTTMQMALAAATQDSRFEPVTLQEVDNLVVEVTVLGRPNPVKGPDEIVLGKHGIVLTKYDQSGQRLGSAVFLPQVPTEFGWDLPKTLSELSQKAGLAADAWQHDCRFEVFEGLVCAQQEALLYEQGQTR